MSDPSSDLHRHTANRLAEVGADAAQDIAARKLRQELKERLPRFLWPLIPGVGGSVGDNVEKLAKRKASNLLWSIGCSIAFFGFFGVLVLGFAAAIGFAVWSSAPG
jgi:hypothetical protein